jgi:hypothetical protein
LSAARGGRHAGHHPAARGKARGGPLGRRPAAHRGAAQEGQAGRARAPGDPARRGLLRGVGHVRRAPLRRLRHGREPGARRRRGDRLRHGQRPPGLRVQPGLHGLRRLALRASRREDLQDHGQGGPGRRAGHRAQRFRRRANPGGRCLARRLRGRVPAQRDLLGRGAADLHDHGALCRRCGLLPGHDRLHLHGQGLLLHVRHGPRRSEDRDPRDRDPRGAGRRGYPHDQVGRRRSCLRERCRGAAGAAPLRRLPARLQPREPAGAADRGSRRARRALARLPGAGRPDQALRHEGADRESGRRGRLLRARTTRATS